MGSASFNATHAAGHLARIRDPNPGPLTTAKISFINVTAVHDIQFNKASLNNAMLGAIIFTSFCQGVVNCGAH